MPEQIDKETRFDLYCESCKYADAYEGDDPCNDCLANPSNTYSRKPVRYEEKER